MFLNLQYIGTMDNVRYRMRNLALDINPQYDFTWWNHYTVDEYLASAADYNFILPDGVDHTEYDIILSFGHKLKYLYYYEDDYIEKWGEEGYRSRPIFEREFVKDSAYVYLIDKTNLLNSEFLDIDIEEFIQGDIPCELPSEDEERRELTDTAERNIIELSYLGNMEETSYRMHYIELELHPDEEFTWWNYYTIDQYLALSEYYDFVLPDQVNQEKHDIIISFGRKLKHLYYYDSDYFSDLDWESEGYRARPVFDEDYIHNSAYVYLIGKTNLADSELASSDMGVFMDSDIPFKLLSVEDEAIISQQ